MSRPFLSPGAFLSGWVAPGLAPTGTAFYPPVGGTGNYPPVGGTGNYPPVGGTGNYPPVGGTGNYPPVGGTGNYPPVGGTGNYPPVGGTGNYPPVGGTGNYPPVGGTGSYPPVGGTSSYPPVGGTGHYADPLAGPGLAVPLASPWQGVDPVWAYQGGSDALLSLALRKVRSHLVPRSDPRRAPPAPRSPAAAPGTVHPLWRWQSPWRLSAVANELLNGLALDGEPGKACVYAVPSPKQLLADQARPVVLARFNWPGESFVYDEQVDRVLRAAVEREDRLPEILSQRDDLTPFFDAVSAVDRGHAPQWMELLAVAGRVTEHVLMGLKHHAAIYRPAQRSSLVHPVIATPGHGAMPSGHATMAALTSRLTALMCHVDAPQRCTQLDLLARRIAFNRVVAGVHYPMDGAAGYVLGHALADQLAAWALGVPFGEARSFTAAPSSDLGERADDGQVRPPVSADLLRALKATDAAAPPRRRAEPAAREALKKPLLAELWRVAQQQLRDALP